MGGRGVGRNKHAARSQSRLGRPAKNKQSVIVSSETLIVSSETPFLRLV